MPPDPTCLECDAELIDIDMAQDPDDPTVRWNTGRCPNPDCAPILRPPVPRRATQRPPRYVTGPETSQPHTAPQPPTKET